jgi:RNA polymerase sigma-70 factor (ECF subfamily)
VPANDPKHAQAFVARSYERFAPELHRYVRRRVRDPQDARDLAQEVWRRLLRIKDTTEVLEPLAYVYRAASNVVAEYHMLRRRNRVSVDSDAVQRAAEHPANIAPDEMADDVAKQAELDRVLASLPKTLRDVLLMRVTDGYSYQEIGARLSLTPKTVEQYFYRAMTLVKKNRTGR